MRDDRLLKNKSFLFLFCSQILQVSGPAGHEHSFVVRASNLINGWIVKREGGAESETYRR